MGPARDTTECMSAYRFRYARYCLRWVAALGLPLVFLLAWAPSVSASPAPFVTLFLYFGLPIGTGTVFVAMLGFLIGGFWSRAAESSAQSERLLERVKFTLLAALALPVFALAVYLSFTGVIDLEVHAFAKNPRHVITWSEQPGWYIVNVLLWGVSGFSGIS